MNVEVAFNTPQVIESLFKNLNVRELCRCACVSKLWNHLSTIELKKRKKTIYFYQGLECSFHKRGHKGIKNCSMKTAGKFEENLDQQIRNLEIKPAFCIAFATLSFLDKFELLFPSHPVSPPKSKKFKKEFDDTAREKYLKSVIKTALKKRLPQNCQVGLFVGKNIINMHKFPEDLLVGDVTIPAISGYFFPELAQQGIQLCTVKNNYREVFRVINTQIMQSGLILLEHKSIAYCALGLSEIQNKFNVFDRGIVFPVEYTSGFIPLFFGPNVETASFNIPFSCDEEFERTAEMEKNGAIAFMFGKYCNSSVVTWKDFHNIFPLIPIVGLWGYYEEDPESNKDTEFYAELIKKHANINFVCKVLLISIKY